MIWIVDLSNHQGDFPVEQLVSEGYSAVIHKASEGTTFKDWWFGHNVEAARTNGLIPGAYHFLRAGNGAEQARVFHAQVAASGGPHGFICACDNEADATWNDTVAFFAEWNQLTGGHPLVMYTGKWWWSPRGWNGASLTPYLWHSEYVSGSGYASDLYEKVPASAWTPGYGGWTEASILQFSSSATVCGRSPIDVNAFRGSDANLRELTTLGGNSVLTNEQAWSLNSALYTVWTTLAKDFDEVSWTHIVDGSSQKSPNMLKQRLLALLASQELVEAALVRIEAKVDALSSIVLTPEQIAELGKDIASRLEASPDLVATTDEVKEAVKLALREGTE